MVWGLESLQFKRAKRQENSLSTPPRFAQTPLGIAARNAGSAWRGRASVTVPRDLAQARDSKSSPSRALKPSASPAGGRSEALLRARARASPDDSWSTSPGHEPAPASSFCFPRPQTSKQREGEKSRRCSTRAEETPPGPSDAPKAWKSNTRQAPLDRYAEAAFPHPNKEETARAKQRTVQRSIIVSTV